jgi:hypothetical protein
MTEHKQQGLGSKGHCVCPKCGLRVPHTPGSPCQENRCTQCGAKLLREGSEHHQAFLEKKRKNIKKQDSNGTK